MTDASQPEFTVVVPAYNEEHRLEKTIEEIVGYFQSQRSRFEVIVVDDGSSDNTSRIAMEWTTSHEEIRLIRLPENRGKGYAVRVGVVNALGARVLFTDADAATPIGEIARLESALTDGADLAIGSRAKQDEHVDVVAKWYRRIIGRIFHGLVQLVAIRGLADTQCGFKLFRAHVAQDLFSCARMDRFSFDVEILVTARLRGYRIDEVPVNWTHQPGSRINMIADSLRMARDLFVIRSNVIRGVYAVSRLQPLDSRKVP